MRTMNALSGGQRGGTRRGQFELFGWKFGRLECPLGLRLFEFFDKTCLLGLETVPFVTDRIQNSPF